VAMVLTQPRPIIGISPRSRGESWVAWRIYPTVQYFLVTGIAPILGIAPVLIHSWSAVACRMDHKPTRSVVTHFPLTKREAQRHTVMQGGYYEK
jgi:hypothetical protein